MSLLDLAGLTVSEIIGDFGFQNYAKTANVNGALQGGFGYVGVVFFLIRSLGASNIMWINGMWDGISGIVETIAAYFILGERLDSWLQYLGIVFIAFGLVLLKYCGGKGLK